MNPRIFEEINSLLLKTEPQEVADALVELIGRYAGDYAALEELIGHYRAHNHASLQRVLAFYLSRQAPSIVGARRNLIYGLVPTIIATGDSSALTNAMTAVQRMSMSPPPWHPKDSHPPEELTALLLAGLRGVQRNVVDAIDLLQCLVDVEILLHLKRVDRHHINNALNMVYKSLNPEQFAALATALQQ